MRGIGWKNKKETRRKFFFTLIFFVAKLLGRRCTCTVHRKNVILSKGYRRVYFLTLVLEVKMNDYGKA